MIAVEGLDRLLTIIVILLCVETYRQCILELYKSVLRVPYVFPSVCAHRLRMAVHRLVLNVVQAGEEVLADRL